MAQGEEGFTVWYPTIKEQALRCNFKNYNMDMVTQDTILYQTLDLKLQPESLSKDLNIDTKIRAGLASNKIK